jgi:hypothetical protein
MKEATDKLFDVFLSYNQTDESWVARLRSALADLGFRAFMARHDINAGEQFPAALERSLERSAAVAFVISPESISSKWVETEYNSALVLSNKNGTPIIPLLLRTADLPAFLSSRQSVDFRDEAMFDAGVQKLLAALQHIRRVGKICFISSEYPPSIVGGLGIHVQELTAALAGHLDVQVDVVLPKPMLGADEYQKTPGNVRTVTVPVDASYSDTASWCRFAKHAIHEITNWSASESPDVIHYHDWVTVLAGIKCRWGFGRPADFPRTPPKSLPSLRIDRESGTCVGGYGDC